MRAPRDYYRTPAWLVEALLPHLEQRLPPGRLRVLEPACGDGAIVQVLESAWGERATVDAVDLEPQGAMIGRAEAACWLSRPLDARRYHLVVTNPPYRHALEYVQRATACLYPYGVAAMLLRLGFLAGQQRSSWLRELRPSVLVSPRRPSFTEDGKCDSSDYGWVIFDGAGRLDWLEVDDART